MRETNVSEPPIKHRKHKDDIRTRAWIQSWDRGVEGDLLTVHVVSGVEGA